MATMTISPKLRKHAVSKWKLAATISDADLRTVIAKKMTKGEITPAEINQLNTAKAAPPPAPVPRKKAGADKNLSRLIRRGVEKVVGRMGLSTGAGAGASAAKFFAKSSQVRVKEAAEQYSNTTKAATYPMFRGAGGKFGAHPLAGQVARVPGSDVPLEQPSDRSKAVALAWVRFMAAKSSGGQPVPQWLKLTDHDRELVAYAAHNEKWSGVLETRDEVHVKFNRQKLTPLAIKTLLDDSTSGGIEITPVVFDDALILTPVLYGELFPFVDVVTVTRGRRVKGGAAVNPTFTSGVAEGTSITPFNTASYVSAFDTAIYPAVAAIELGMDFEDDSPVDLGGQVVDAFGFKALEWLDRTIAYGNGYSEPQGIFNATAATNVNSVYGSGGPFTVSDVEGMMFGLPKQFRNEANAFTCYVSNDYTYRKTRAIPVGPGDERRVFGMDHAGYKLLDYDHKIQNDIPDGYLGFVNLRRYRMYRRLGMTVRIETGGRQLALNNTRLIVVRMRYGGQLTIGGAAALMKDGQVM